MYWQQVLIQVIAGFFYPVKLALPEGLQTTDL